MSDLVKTTISQILKEASNDQGIARLAKLAGREVADIVHELGLSTRSLDSLAKELVQRFASTLDLDGALDNLDSIESEISTETSNLQFIVKKKLVTASKAIAALRKSLERG